jgi:hypothetical protein
MARFNTGKVTHSGVGHLSETGDAATLQGHFDGLAELFDAVIGGRDTVIKIDVEGAEGHVVNSLRAFLRRPQVKKVIAEIDPTYLKRFGHDDGHVYAALAEAGFEPRRGRGAAPHYNEVFERRLAAPANGEIRPTVAELA